MQKEYTKDWQDIIQVTLSSTEIYAVFRWKICAKLLSQTVNPCNIVHSNLVMNAWLLRIGFTIYTG